MRKCVMSASVEIIFFWAWLIILVEENEPKSKETTVNYFEYRHHLSIEENASDNSELVNQDTRIVWASPISSLEVATYDCLLNRFSPLQTPLFRIKMKKKSHFQLMFEPVIEVKFVAYYCHDCPLAGNTRRLFEILSVIWFGNLGCNHI